MSHVGFTEKLSELIRAVDERKARARERLADPSGKWWSYGMLGFSMLPHEYRIDTLAVIRPVHEPPGEFELAAALNDKTLVPGIARYSSGLNYELAISPDAGKEENDIFNFAWWILSALRIRTLAEILIPVAANHSWSTIAGANKGSVSARLIEDVPQALRLDASRAISQSELDWVAENVLELAALIIDVPKFRLAVEALTTHHHQASLRMMIAALWSGIEALFEVQTELRYRLSTYVACFLEPRGASRHSLYRNIKTHYDFRSKAVHGSALTDKELSTEIRKVRTLLSQLLCRLVELKRVPSPDELDVMLFE